jgi:GDP-L-fucose synthase
VTVWGTGVPRREFLYVDDLADACLYLMQHYEGEDFINVGVGEDISIAELASLVKDVVGFEGEIVYDTEKLDGTPRKLLDVSRIEALGWRAATPLREGIESTYRWFLKHQADLRD